MLAPVKLAPVVMAPVRLAFWRLAPGEIWSENTHNMAMSSSLPSEGAEADPLLPYSPSGGGDVGGSVTLDVNYAGRGRLYPAFLLISSEWGALCVPTGYTAVGWAG